MATTVVNRSKVKGVAPHFDVYIGRADDPRFGRWKASEWHNPFEMDTPRRKRDGTREEVIERFRTYLLEERPDLVARLPELRGKVLGCWCKPKACHGDVLAELADRGE